MNTYLNLYNFSLECKTLTYNIEIKCIVVIISALSPEYHLYDPMLKHENGVKLTDGFSNGNHHHQDSSSPRISSPRNMNMFHYIPARLVLYFLSWSGFLVSFMMRNDINFAIVVMVKNANKTINTLRSNESISNETSTEATLTDVNEIIIIRKYIAKLTNVLDVNNIVICILE